MTLIPRDYQSYAVDSIFSYWENKAGNPIVLAPTGSGKSIMISMFIMRALKLFPDTRIIVASHVMEILTQDFEKLYKMWPEAPMGIYSAGLGKRQFDAQILFAGIQSIYKKGYESRRTDIVLLDECHLLSPNDETRYRRFIKALKDNNQYLKVCGFSATPYRLDSGWLHKGENPLFTDICCDINVLDLINEGYLVEPISKAAHVEVDLSGLHTRGGEYIPAEMEKALDKAAITKAAVKEIIEFGRDRKTWLIFSSGLSHSQHICEELRAYGVECAIISGDTPKAERTRLIEDAKNGSIKCLVNYAVLTTGVDIERIDLIALLRKTKSTSLYQQMIGRGLRIYNGKKNCAVLDFCQNAMYHGPIDNVIIRDKNTAEDGEAPSKMCPQCRTIVFAGCATCKECGYKFPPPKPAFEGKAKKAPLLTTQQEKISQEPVWLNVNSARYQIHKKAGKPDSLRVDYNCSPSHVSEWLPFAHGGYARDKAHSWWRERGGKLPAPQSAAEALNRIAEIGSVKTTAIKVKKEGKFDRIMGYKIIPAQSGNIITQSGNMGQSAVQA